MDPKDMRISDLENINAALVESLEACEDYFDQRADAEYFTDSAMPKGNEEMLLLVAVRAALKLAKGE